VKKEPKTNISKQPYVTPRLRVIELLAEEVMGVGCKLLGGGLMNIALANCGIGTCVSTGS
jgi:hypothetical protein